MGLDGGNYRPVGADKTWERRLGDCKGKAALLLALLRELGIEAEPMLVNSKGGDGTDQRLPTPAAFDHVVVRAKIGARNYWLDGTRLGDARLDALDAPAFRWALPLRAGPTTLEAVAAVPPLHPQQSVVLDIDATAGFAQPAKVRAEQVLRGDDVFAVKTRLASLSPEDAERTLKAYWRNENSWITPATAAWRFDAPRGALILTMTGEGKPDWEGDDKAGRALSIYSAGFTPPSELIRPAEQDQSAPWLTNFPRYRRWTTVIHLPQVQGWTWAYRAAPVHRRLGGVSYWREAELRDGVVRTTMSRRTYLPEITAAQALEVNAQIAAFDNKMSRVYQRPAAAPAAGAADKVPAMEAAAGKDLSRLQGLAMFLMTSQRYDDAIRVFNTALALDPKAAGATAGKAVAMKMKGDVPGALALLDTAMKTSAAPELPLMRADVLMQAGRRSEALAQLDAVRIANPTNSRVSAAVAEQLSQIGEDEKALQSADQAHRLEPDNIAVLLLRAAIQHRLGRTDQTLADLGEAMALEPENPQVLTAHGAALAHAGRLEDALADIEEALRINPLDPTTLGLKVTALQKVGRTSEAAAARDEWVRWDHSGMALNDRCWKQAIANTELAKAELDCAGAIKLGPKVASYWDSYGLVALRTGRLDDARRRYDAALAINPKLAPSLYARGLTRIRAGDRAGGQADVAAAQSINPKVDTELTAAGVTP